jgi:hypothetical protein
MDFYFTPLSLFITFCICISGLSILDILINALRGE